MSQSAYSLYSQLPAVSGDVLLCPRTEEDAYVGLQLDDTKCIQTAGPERFLQVVTWKLLKSFNANNGILKYEVKMDKLFT